MIHIDTKRTIGIRSPLLYGQFIEHFHRQIYGGVYDPQSPFADEMGFRKDVIEAMRRIKVPILRWPGGCFVSSYHWKDAVGKTRTPLFDKAWRVEDPNTFGTDEYIALCRKIGCEPYICTNAGTGTAEEMSDWVEYCNLENEGAYAKQRIENGHAQPYAVKYWSIGNENYGFWEIGAKSAAEWGRLVLESAKMMKHVDPRAELSAAALPDVDWNLNLLKHCGQHIDWVSVHKYWNLMPQINQFATYEQTMAYTNDLDTDIQKVRGLLTAMGLEKKIKIAYDEWNLRGWHHPNVHTIRQGVDKDEYIAPRDKNDINRDYTMADAVFTACFLNALNRNCDIVGMANFAPIVNTRGAIYTYDGGLVLRTTYHVFDLYVNHMGDTVLDLWSDQPDTYLVTGLDGGAQQVDCMDALATKRSDTGAYAISLVNKHEREAREIVLGGLPRGRIAVLTLCGASPDDYNDIGKDDVKPLRNDEIATRADDGAITVRLPAHSVNVLEIIVD